MIREFKCPYGDDFEGGDECDRCEQYELCMKTYPPLNLIEIPKGATNGDMIKAMLQVVGYTPLSTWTEEKRKKSGFRVHIKDEHKCDFSLTVSEDWWNAPYRKVGE